MKRFLSWSVLLLMFFSVATPSMGQSKKEAKAFSSALQENDPARRAAALEAFVEQYPNSPWKITALERALLNYKKAGLPDKSDQTAKRLLGFAPNNVLALDWVAIRLSLEVEIASLSNSLLKESASPDLKLAIVKLRQISETGLAALAIWGQGDRSQQGDQSQAESETNKLWFRYDLTYGLAVARLENDPPQKDGLWYAAKSYQLAKPLGDEDAADSAKRLGEGKYKDILGSLNGWDQLLAKAAAQDSPPSDFAAPLKPATSLPAGQKVFKDKAEYDAYMSGLNTQDPQRRAAAMEDFLRKYPNSAMKPDALEQAMATYQQANNSAKVQEMADHLLQINPNNVRALAFASFIKRNQGSPEAAAEGRTLALRGLQALPGWQKPEEMKDDEFKRLRDQMTVIFADACGFGALQVKDYGPARDCYLKSLQINPNDLTDNYQLGIADLEMTPLDVRGFWHIAKAVNLAQGNEAGQKQIAAYGRSKYRRYHGSEQGWDQIVAASATQPEIPPGFANSIKPGSIHFVLDQENIAKALERMPADEKAELFAEMEASDLRQKGDLDGVVAKYREVVSRYPASAEAHVGLGKALRDKGDLDGAIREFGEAARIQPKEASHYDLRGDSYNRKEQYDKALADFNKALELSPQLSSAIGGRADALYSTGQYQNAKIEYTRYLATAHDSAMTWTRRANCNYALGTYRDAITDYQKAIELDPKLINPLNGLAWLLATAPDDGVRNGTKAIEYAQKAVALSGKDKFYYLDTLAASYAEAGRFAEAIAQQSNVLSLMPKTFDPKQKAEFQSRLALYKQHKAFRDKSTR